MAWAPSVCSRQCSPDGLRRRWHHRQRHGDRSNSTTCLDFDLQHSPSTVPDRQRRLASRALALHDKLTVLEPHTSPSSTTARPAPSRRGTRSRLTAAARRRSRRGTGGRSARGAGDVGARAAGALGAARGVARAEILMRLAQATTPSCARRLWASSTRRTRRAAAARLRVEGGRLLRLDCPTATGSTLDDHAELREYRPVRLGDAEAVVFCGREPRMLLAHPKFEPSLVARAPALPPPWSAPRLPSVLVLMVDATNTRTSAAACRSRSPLEELSTPRRWPPPRTSSTLSTTTSSGTTQYPTRCRSSATAEELHALRGDAA